MKTVKNAVFKMKVLVPLAVLWVLLAADCVALKKGEGEMISEFGKYQGYSEKVYDGYKIVSDYLSLADGTRLAYDVYLPTKDGVPADTPLPALFHYTPYGRRWTIINAEGENNLAKLMDMPWYMSLAVQFRSRFVANGDQMDKVFLMEWLKPMLMHGYVLVAVDRPDTGASFGKLDESPAVAAREADEILHWIAEQDWCDGNIGMFGDSIQAQIQFLAASTGNPHLKAILPATTWMENYSGVMYPGGILDQAFRNFYIKANQTMDAMATPVDSDTDGTLLAEIRAERTVIALTKDMQTAPVEMYRDVRTHEGISYWEELWSLAPFIDQINQSGVPVYLINGWFDIYARDNFVIYNNLTVPKRLLIRPVDHSSIEGKGKDVDYGAEALRWFDYWLKGIDNGIMAEAPIHYSIMNGNGKAAVHSAYGSADVWPLANMHMAPYYFTSGGSAENAGALVSSLPAASTERRMSYTVDYSTTSGGKPRWASAANPHKYPDMRGNDAKAITYTSNVLTQTVRITGHPVVHIWLSTEASDLDLFVYLEEVSQNGSSIYITEGCLRASHRALGEAPYAYLDLPFHTFYKTDVMPIPAGEPVELVLDLLPTSYKFSEGKQIRITIAFADAGNFSTPILDPAPVVTLLQDADHRSYIELPVVESP